MERPVRRRLPRGTFAATTVIVLGAVVGIGGNPAHAQGVAGGTPAAEARIVMITGSTDGLGREVALELAGQGTHLIVHGRNRERGAEVVRAIEAAGGSARFYQADLAHLDEVRGLGEAVLRDYSRLDVLVNNAGIWLTADQGRQLNPAGHELHFAVNYLSHYLLTHQLLPLLTASAPSRIINVASLAQQPIDFEDVMMERNYSDGRGYAQSKLAQILFTVDMARELEGTGVTVNSLHPATMMNTSMVLSRGAASRSTVEEGVDAVLHLITVSDLGTGKFFNGTTEAQAHAQTYDDAARARLRQISNELTGIS
jgi:NAD(P)-dependent dehydrogenase (short-subunit alcohol dehydrogenase family)